MRAPLKALLAAAALAAAVPARASVDLGLRQTKGSFDYDGTDAWAQFSLGDELTLKPEYQQYSSTQSGGTSRTYQARLAADNSARGLGLTVGDTPTLDGYKNTFIGVDGRVSVASDGHGGLATVPKSGAGSEAGTAGSSLPRFDLGAGLQWTFHDDQVDALRRHLTANVRTRETDLNLNAAVKFAGTTASVAWTDSTYNRNLTVLDRAALRLRLPGVDGTLQGFPDKSVTLRLDLPEVFLTSLFGTYTRTSYKTNPGTTTVWGGGFTVGLDSVDLYGKVEYTRPVDIPPPDNASGTNFTLGVTVHFG